MLEKFLHKTLRFPYALHVSEFQPVKKPTKTVIMLHGIGSSSKMWEKIAKSVPAGNRVIAIDLLGFGNSPKPSWKDYNVKSQVDSIATTLLKKRVTGPVILVGHSLGSLVCIEFAKRYPILVESLILCSPPLYEHAKKKPKLLPSREKFLIDFYKQIHSNPSSANRLLALGAAYTVFNKGYMIDQTNAAIFLATLEASIVNQTSINDIAKLKKPTRILVGAFDLIVLTKNIKKVVRENQRITYKTVAGSHEITGPYKKAVIDEIKQAVSRSAKRSKYAIINT